MNEAQEWSYPFFEEPFKAVQFQQGFSTFSLKRIFFLNSNLNPAGNDAEFTARIGGIPRPLVSWTHRGRPVVSNNKYQLLDDPNCGKVSLKIIDLGPGDEGQFCCTISNDYGSCTATLTVNPDVNRLRHRGLSPTCCRRTFQKRIKDHRQREVEDVTL